jgi:hypothetical protein
MCVKSRTDNEAPNRVIPKTESDEPKRANDLTEIAAPMWKKSSTERELPKRVIPNTDMEEPQRAKPRNDKDEPI